ncbi:Uncharacterised protein [Mycobacteroides abscessus subsp. massiliense]|nr:Uncharacterised protein [Mycobacteroides abscessus subsp. massiliense]
MILGINFRQYQQTLLLGQNGNEICQFDIFDTDKTFERFCFFGSSRFRLLDESNDFLILNNRCEFFQFAQPRLDLVFFLSQTKQCFRIRSGNRCELCHKITAPVLRY